MKKAAFGMLAAAVVLLGVVASSGKAEAATVWPGHYETPYVHSNPAFKASLDITGYGWVYVVRLHDAIPMDAWNNPDCHGPADATGLGVQVASNQMAVWFFWSCADGTTRISVRYLRFSDHSDTNPANDEIVFCNGAVFSTCGLVFHRTP